MITKLETIEPRRPPNILKFRNFFLVCWLALLVASTSSAEDISLWRETEILPTSTQEILSQKLSESFIFAKLNNSISLQKTGEPFAGTVLMDMRFPYNHSSAKKTSAGLNLEYHFSGDWSTRGSLVVLLDGKPASYTSMLGFNSTASSSFKRLSGIALDNKDVRITVLCTVKRNDPSEQVSCSLSSICLYDMKLQQNKSDFDCKK